MNKPSNQLSHKEHNLARYLKGIWNYALEKNQLLEHIIRQPEGIYVDIWPGSAGLPTFMTQLPNSPKLMIVACDLSYGVLQNIVLKNNVAQFLPSGNAVKRNDWLTLSTKVCTATELPFTDGTISGINMSAVFHKIFSYEGIEWVEKAFQELQRVLEVGGKFIYRDGEQLDQPQEKVVLEVTESDMKQFINFFLPYFVMRDKKSRRMQRASETSIEFFLAGIEKKQEMSLTDYLMIPTDQIDFEADYRVNCSARLAHEIKRHYITFLHHCGIDQEKQTANQIFGDQGHYLSVQWLQHLPKGSLKTRSYALRKYDKKVRVDPKMLPFLSSVAFESVSSFIQWQTKKDRVIINYLVSEWLENYFFMTLDEFLCSIIKQTLILDHKETDQKKWLVLAPLSSEKNYYIERSSHKWILQKTCQINGYSGDTSIQGKRIIHFEKMSLEKAFITLSKIVLENPERYPKLKKLLSEILENPDYQLEQWTNRARNLHF